MRALRGVFDAGLPETRSVGELSGQARVRFYSFSPGKRVSEGSALTCPRDMRAKKRKR